MADEQLTPSATPPLAPVPGVQIATGNVALRCSACNRTSQWNETFVKANRGQNVVCPLCAAAVKLP